MKRHNDWQLHLEAFVRERWTTPFSWGSNDCVLFAADAVQAMTGERLCPELRGQRDVRACLRVLRDLGDVRGIATRALGEPISPLMARIGDVVAVKTGKREALAVCNGGNALLPGPRGVAVYPMRDALAAWRVG
jgi:hypothetical protein